MQTRTLGGTPTSDAWSTLAWLAFPASGPLVLPLPETGELILGREEPADLIIPDDSISRRHARVLIRDGEVRLEDLGSKNGTRLDGTPCAPGERRIVEPSMEVLLGSVRLALHRPAQSGAESRLVGEESLERRLDEELARPGAQGFVVLARGERRALDLFLHTLRPYERAAWSGRDELTLLWPVSSPDEAQSRARAWAQASGGRVSLAPLAAGKSRAERLEAVREALRGTSATDPVVMASQDALRVAPPGEPPALRLSRVVALSPAMQAVLTKVSRLGSTPLSVVIEGPTGTGKEVIAQLIHGLGPQASAPFVAVSCATLTPSLMNSGELFGHEAHAFTDAKDRRPGLFEAASGGTLFLDEVGELSPEAQAALLRALEQRAIRRVGGTQEVPVTVRVVSATAAPLEKLVEAGRFRDDLYFRLAGETLELPPLAARPQDILPLARLFLSEAAAQFGRAATQIGPEAEEALLRYGWPGNVRELRQVIHRAVAHAEADTLGPEHLPERLMRAPARAPGGSRFPVKLRDELARVERELVRAALVESKGNRSGAARLLGLPERTLGYRLQVLGLDAE